jgi:Protein of unknown function (DUF2946)
MRRRLNKYLPIVLIALTVQILTPIAASWAAAMATSDPFGSAEICHSLPAPDSGQGNQDADHRVHDGACPICRATQVSSPLNTLQAVVVAMPYRAVARVEWHEEIARQGRSSIGVYAQARAPPLSM